jgi:hypothetical protein
MVRSFSSSRIGFQPRLRRDASMHVFQRAEVLDAYGLDLHCRFQFLEPFAEDSDADTDSLPERALYRRTIH